MSENQNRGVNDFSKYDSMATEELEEILRLDAEAPEGQESDGELLLYVMGVLARRKRDSENPGKTAQQAWESFEKHYLPCEEEAHTTQGGRKTSRLCRWIAGVAAAAALAAIPLTAGALTWEEIWNTVAKWAKNTFSFVSVGETTPTEPAKSDSHQYNSLRNAMIEAGEVIQPVPTYIPDGYELDRIVVDETPVRKTYIGFYKSEKASLKIAIQSHIGSDPEKVEINEDLLESYIVSGTEYYIFANVDQLRVIWLKDSYGCSISGSITVEEIKKMIDSIGKG